jgi:hypothetical protein
VDYFFTEFSPCGLCESSFGGEQNICTRQTDVVGGEGPFVAVTTFTACYSFWCFCGSSLTRTAFFAGDCEPV